MEGGQSSIRWMGDSKIEGISGGQPVYGAWEDCQNSQE